MTTSSIDIQLTRDYKTGTLPYLTNWSRHEPATINRSALGNTDHWAKTKHKNVTLFTTNNKGETHFYPGERCLYELPPKEASLKINPSFKVETNMKHIGHESFTNMMLRMLNNNRPGEYYRTRPTPKRIPRSSYYDRAREGHEYWWHETKPTFKKTWMGAAGNVLGTQIK